LKRMLDNKDWGRVVFVSSESGVFIPEGDGALRLLESAQLVIARGAAETTRAPTYSQFGDARSDLGRDGAGPSGRARRGCRTTVDDLVQRTFTERRRRRCCSATPCRKRSPT
jgi:hypothetical protein